MNLYSLFVYIEHNGEESPKDSVLFGKTIRHHIDRSRSSEILVSTSRVEMIYSFYYMDLKGIYDKGSGAGRNMEGKRQRLEEVWN